MRWRSDARAKMSENRGAGRCDSFTRTPVVQDSEPFEEEYDRRGRYGQQSVCGRHAARSGREHTDGPRRRSAALDHGRRRDDVDDRVPGTDLMEGNVVRGDTMHSPFGFRENGEDVAGPIAHGVVDGRRVEPGKNAACVAMVRMRVIRLLSDHELRPGKDSVRPRNERRGNRWRKIQRRQKYFELRPERRVHVEQRGDEHIAGDATNGIEMKVHGSSSLAIGGMGPTTLVVCWKYNPATTARWDSVTTRARPERCNVPSRESRCFDATNWSPS